MQRRRWSKRYNNRVKQAVSEEPDRLPRRDGDLKVDQLKQLVEIQSQIVKLAEQNKRAKRSRTALRTRLTGGPRRLLKLLAQLF